jgi:hypothetical protein
MKKFVFIHNIGDWIFRTLIIIILISIILHSYPYLILLASLIGIVICYYLIHKSKEIKLFDDFFYNFKYFKQK